MTSIPIKGYNVGFPYETPYDLQKVYMEKVLTCLDDEKHGVLESPTGTGKTLCLFAPVAAWAKKRKEERYENCCSETNLEDDKNPEIPKVQIRKKVWYTSRTHSQIGQTVMEVRKCNIQKLNISVMGSREQLCINPEVQEEKEAYVKIVKCQGLVKDKKCSYYQKYQREKDYKSYYELGEVLDIEDLVSLGKAKHVCPYFLAKNSAEMADIVLLPYNYIIDRDAREGNSLNLSNDIIIFDEGHNIPAKCEESYEFTLTTLDMVSGVKSVQSFVEHLETGIRLYGLDKQKTETSMDKHLSNARFLHNILRNLEIGLFKLVPTNQLKPVAYLYDFFERAGITPGTAENILFMISAFQVDSSPLNLPGHVIAVFHLLEKMLIVTYGPTIRLFDEKTIEKSFKCGITIENKNKPNECKKISLFCFNPSFGIRTLLELGVQSIIITSGTLSPLKTFIYELGLPDPVTLENDHIAKKCQVPFVILEQGVCNEKMDSSYKNRDNPKYITSLGMTLTNLISSIPDGVLLLFASYALMGKFREEWESQGIWTRLTNLKRVFIEPREKEEFINCMENYKRAINSGNGAVLLGVLRGKISEGMDFKDQYCRGVFIIGVPFPPIKDPKIEGKIKYCEDLMYFNPEKKQSEKVYTHSYTQVEAMKVTNQAVGRVIRHRNDYGAIILVDYRFAWNNLFFNLSAWLRGDRVNPKNFQETKKILGEFFRNIHTGKLGVQEVRCQKVDDKGIPIAGRIPYEEYDHKIAVREHNHNAYAKELEYVYDSPVKVKNESALATPVENMPFLNKLTQEHNYNTVVIHQRPNSSSTQATLAYRNATVGKSIITYDDDSASSDDTICDATPSIVSFVQSEEDDLSIISAMDNLESSTNPSNFNEIQSPFKDIANNKRKHLGEVSDNNSQSLIKSPRVERRRNSALPKNI